MIDIHEYVSIETADDIAIVNIDVKAESMNIISPTLIEVFDQVFAQLIADSSIKGIIITSKRRDFIAGADIKSFKADRPGDFMPVLQKGHQILNKIEDSPKPIVAAISGTCYGLGVELSLACHARIASDASETKLALPEVKLGLLPGAGGTVRLPSLIGLMAALDIMLTGKNIYPYQAKKMGLVNEVVPLPKLRTAAIDMVKRLIRKEQMTKPKVSLVQSFFNRTWLGQKIVLSQATKKVLQQTRGYYPAPLAILDCVSYQMGKSREQALLHEAEQFEKLLLGQVSKHLIGLFFAMTSNKKNPCSEYVKPTKQLGIVGGGFMGEGIASVSLNKVEQIWVCDLQPKSLQTLLKRIWESLQMGVKKKINNSIQVEQWMHSLHVTEKPEDLKHCDLIVEAVVEKLEVKQSVIRNLFSLGKENLIVATNTSSLSLKALQAAVDCPERLIGMHYFSPVQKMPLLEIVVTNQTGKEAIAAAFDLGLKQGKTCVVVQDGPGFYVNRILAPYLNECLLLMEEGVDIKTIEEGMLQWGFPVGPFQLMDEVGFDIIVHATQANQAFAAARKGYQPNQLLENMFKMGYKGRKNLRGFYQYASNGKRLNAFDKNLSNFLSKQKANIPKQDILERPLYLMLQEAQSCLSDAIIANEQDGNLAAIFGIGFMPFTGGPFELIKALGKDYSDRMRYFASQYGDRFHLQ